MKKALLIILAIVCVEIVASSLIQLRYRMVLREMFAVRGLSVFGDTKMTKEWLAEGDLQNKNKVMMYIFPFGTAYRFRNKHTEDKLLDIAESFEKSDKSKEQIDLHIQKVYRKVIFIF